MTEEQKERARARNRKWVQANPEKVSANKRKWARANPEKVSASVRKWKKANPEKERANFRKWKQAHPEKARASVRQWKQANPNKVSAIQRKYSKAHPEKNRAKSRKRRALKNGQDEHFNDLEWQLLCEQYDQRCLRCGEKKPLTPDHVIPLGGGWGGKDTIDNIQPLCLRCNSRKNATYVDYRNREPIKVKQLSFLSMVIA